MKPLLCFSALLVSAVVIACASTQPEHSAPTSTMQIKEIITLSRNATTQISSIAGNSKGTGFIIGRRHVVTCFHVVARTSQENGQIKWDIYQDLKIKFINGQEITGKVVSIPTQQAPDPLFRDFAVIELQQDVPQEATSSILEVADPKFEVGDDIVFSGYPLATPAMVTHKGMVSGYDAKSKIICLQASINKGNSGGAVCDSAGKVIGIVSMREGGIAVGLSELNAYIAESGKHGSVAIMGVDPLQAIRAISETLDTYISTGIGYAQSSDALRSYLDQRPELKR